MTFVPNKAGTDASLTPSDPQLSGANRSFADAAGVLAATPLYVGEIVYSKPTAGVQGASYQGTALSAGAWQAIAVKA